MVAENDEDRLGRYVADWHPTPQECEYEVRAVPVVGFASLLDQPAPQVHRGAAIPPLWHLLLAPDQPRSHELGEDGHPRDGRFLPPIPNRQRLFAGGRALFHEPLRVGDTVQRRTELVSSRVSRGRGGGTVFVTVRTTHHVAGQLRVTDEQDIAYRRRATAARGPGVAATETPAVSAGPAGTAGPDPSLHLVPDPVLLFRFSALTYNAHRIHYDLPYATGVEGLPGLLVQGPLLALLLLELPRRFDAARRVTAFSFRLRRPTVSGVPLVVTADGTDLRAGPAGAPPAVTGEIELA